MFNQTGIKTEKYGNITQILKNVELQESVGIVVDDSVATADSLGRKIYIDVKGDHYPNPTNILLEVMDGYGHSWLQTTSKMQHITNYILYIRYNATNDSITASLIDYEYLTKVFVYTDLYKDRVLYNIGDKTIGSYFREDELPSVPKFYPELGRVVKPLVRTLKVLKSKFSIEIQNKIKKYTENIYIIDDAYNSNPVGSKMAVDVLKMMKGKRIIVTPGMIDEFIFPFFLFFMLR